MTGGYGNDKFFFNFSYATQDYYFLGQDNAIGGTGDNADADHPAQNANLNAWQNAYAAWLASLGGEVTFVGEQSTIPVGNVNPQPFTYHNQVSVTALTGDGNDIITDYTHTTGPGQNNDSLVFVGITAEQAIALMTTSITDVNGDTVLDTVIHAGDSSITLLGVSDFGSIADAIAAHKIDFA